VLPPFRLATAARIEFGRGRFEEIGRLIAELGRSALVVSNAGGSEALERLRRLAAIAGVGIETVALTGEPEVEEVDRVVAAARAAGSEVLVGIGGGSAIDAAKAAAGLLENGGTCLDYMEVVGAGRPIRLPARPWIAVPVTGGTGAEVTQNAVIGARDKAYKASIRSPLLLARVALVDPELGVGVRREVTARCGMDALTQCIESHASKGANPITDALSLEGVRRAGRSLRRAAERGDDLEAREDLALAALLSGITLASAGLGAVHGLAAPLGARFPVPHGTVCAAILPHVLAANVEALRRADPRHRALARYAAVGRALAGNPIPDDERAVEALLESARDLVRDLGIPGLGAFGVGEGEIPAIAAMARRASSMKFNPVELPPEVLEEVVRRALTAERRSS
jgi:alcohol dehydrogenase class IV